MTQSTSTQSPRDTSPTMTDLRHMTSLGALSTSPATASRRTSQHMAAGRRAESIPSSPTSIHSSSSAIFERDIEPLHPSLPASFSLHTRSRHPELENSVPSVLDAAASILAPSTSSPAAAEDVLVVSPLSGFSSTGGGWASPVSIRSLSRSPSFTTMTNAASSPKSIMSSMSARSPVAMPPLEFSTSASPSPSSSPSPPSPLALSPSKRLSFLSYSDILSSTPASVLPLSSLTTMASAAEERAHVICASQSASRAPSVRGRKDRESMLFLDGAIGGEWEREGLGRGLEERLEGML